MKHSLLTLLMLLCAASTAKGHATSTGSLRLTVGERAIEATVSTALRDLDALLALDADGDRLASARELEAKGDAIRQYVLSRIEVRGDGELCTLHDARSSAVQAQVVTEVAVRCPTPLDRISVRYELFFEHDAAHRGFVNVRMGERSVDAVITTEQRELSLQRAGGGHAPSLAQYIREGVLHIWLGFDHLAFLLVLLLPSVLARGGAASERAELGLGRATVATLKVVTAFTVAHSLTLSVAALRWIELPSALVESAIAASIIVAALANLRPAGRAHGPAMAFAFGLLHGFGFASVLRELGLPSGTLLPALFGFNLGVELGQLCLVVPFFGLAFTLRKTRVYRARIVPVGSLVASIVAALWLIERVFGLEIFAALWQLGGRVSFAHPLALSGLGLCLFALLLRVTHAGRASTRSRRILAPHSVAWAGVVVGVVGLASSAWLAKRTQASTLARAAAELRTGQRLQTLHRLDQARDRYAASSALYAEAEDFASQAEALSALGDVELRRAAPLAARTSYLEALAIREQRGDDLGVVRLCHELAVVAEVRGELTEATRWLRRAVALEEQLGLLASLRSDSVRLAELYRQTGQLGAARTALQRAVQVDEQLQSRAELAEDTAKLAIIHQLEERWDEARALYRHVIALHEELGQHVALANALANDATAARQQGQREQAATAYRRALALYEQEDEPARAVRVRELLHALEPQGSAALVHPSP